MKFCLHFSLPDCLKLTLAGHWSDMKVNMVANMKVNMVADMELD